MMASLPAVRRLQGRYGHSRRSRGRPGPMTVNRIYRAERWIARRQRRQMRLPMINRKLYRIPEEGMIKGVCAGLADYLGVPVALVRVMAVLSIFCGLFFLTVTLYVALAIFLPVTHEASRGEDDALTSGHRLQETGQTLDECEQRLRRVERYVTSDAFGVRSRFRDL